MTNEMMMLVNPIFSSRELEIDPRLIFVLMPFNDSFTLLYKQHIVPVVSELNLICKRADEISIPGNVMEDVWKNIYQSRLLIADISDNNPNVFYEIGIAHAIGKNVILICNEQNVSFDLRNVRYFGYTDSPGEMQYFDKRLRHVIKETLRSSAIVEDAAIQAKTTLISAFKIWRSSKVLPTLEQYKLITQFSDELVDSMDDTQCAFMYRAALHHGEHLIFWSELNHCNLMISEQIDDVVREAYRRPVYRIGLSLEFVDDFVRVEICRKYESSDNDKLKMIFSKARARDTIEYWKSGEIRDLSKIEIAIMMSQVGSSKRRGKS